MQAEFSSMDFFYSHVIKLNEDFKFVSEIGKNGSLKFNQHIREKVIISSYPCASISIVVLHRLEKSGIDQRLPS